MTEHSSPERQVAHPLVISPRLSQMPRILNTLELKRESISLGIGSANHNDVHNFVDKTRTPSIEYDVEEIRSVRQLLVNLHKSARLNADVHYESIKHYERLNLKANILILVISMSSSIIAPIMDSMAHEQYMMFVSTSYAIIGGLGVILNRLGYQTKMEKHTQARESFIEIVDLIEMTMAYANEEGASQTYDFTHVLNEVQQIRHNLNKFAPPILDEIMSIVLDRMTDTGAFSGV